MAKETTVTDTDKGWKQALKNLRKVAGGHYVVVGVRGAKGAEVEEGEELNLAQIAAVNEFGSKDGHVPERSFLRSTVDNKKAEYTKDLRAAVKAVTDGADIEVELGRFGVKVAGNVVETINAGVGPPNAARTIAAKGSDHTLVADSRLRQSIDSEVRKE